MSLYITQPPLSDLDNVLMKYNEPSKFHPTFSLPSPQWHAALPLLKYERTAFGFSTPVLPFFLIVCYLPFAFNYSFFMRCFKPRGECTLEKYIDSTLFRVYVIESVVSPANIKCVFINHVKLIFWIKTTNMFRPPFVLTSVHKGRNRILHCRELS